MGLYSPTKMGLHSPKKVGSPSITGLNSPVKTGRNGWDSPIFNLSCSDFNSPPKYESP